MPTTCGAWTTDTFGGSPPAKRRTTASSPTRMTRSAGFVRANVRAPLTTSSGPWSPPIASTATRTPCAGRASGVAPSTASGGRFVAAGRLELDRLAAAVVAAVRAGVMRLLHLAAVRTLLELRQADRKVAASLTLAGVGHPPLGHTHRVHCSFHVPGSAAADRSGIVFGGTVRARAATAAGCRNRRRSLLVLGPGVDLEGLE